MTQYISCPASLENVRDTLNCLKKGGELFYVSQVHKKEVFERNILVFKFIKMIRNYCWANHCFELAELLMKTQNYKELVEYFREERWSEIDFENHWHGGGKRTT